MSERLHRSKKSTAAVMATKKRLNLGESRRLTDRYLNPNQPDVNIILSREVSKRFIDKTFIRPKLRVLAYDLIVGMTGNEGEAFVRWDDCIIALIDTLLDTKRAISDVPPEPVFFAALREHLRNRESELPFICRTNPREDIHETKPHTGRKNLYCHS